ncbi:hypothetical protein LTR09_010452 [Extremus antarcticus]|uniref:Uncharacterized protein n=1 Tax=Extremus antarcticus TaxID=702011 RepID=A0AAJ0DDG3_9PEZI|nr:hypothetical protein LTR09_010452 [Extremus antarcticus]
MSHPIVHDDQDSDHNIVLKPKPRRPFELSSPPPSAPSTPPAEQTSFPPSYLQPSTQRNMAHATDGAETPSRTKSFLNLTSSTLFGIYQPTGYSTERDERSAPYGETTPWTGNTPWGTGAQTPAEQSPSGREGPIDWSRARLPEAAFQNGINGNKLRRKSAAPPQQRPRRGFRATILPVAARTLIMFTIGVGYALMITHLHDHRGIAPVQVNLNRGSWTYLAMWGCAGVLLGEALPWADRFWESDGSEHTTSSINTPQRKDRGLDGWMDVVRAIGAFVGIAFAIRKLPWQSSLQLSLTLALANPALWYLIDRSPPGFILSSFFALVGTAVLLGINPALVPEPSPAQVLRRLVARNGGGNGTAMVREEDLMLGVFSPESVGVATWIASVLFTNVSILTKLTTMTTE